MKRIINIAIVSAFLVGIVACNDRFDGDEIKTIDKVAIDSVRVVSDTMVVYDIQSITTFSNYNAGCEGFYGYNYDRDQLDRYVTAYKYKTDASCTNIVAAASKFDFRPEQTGTYVFKFWKGKDQAGNDIWDSKNIVVTN